MDKEKAIDDLKEKTIYGTMWKMMERFSAKAVSMIVSIILARLLTPDDYSVVGIVAIFFTFANVFITGGFNTALIQKKNVDDLDYSSVMVLSFGVASIMYVILFFCAPFIASLYDQSILVPVIRIMGLTLFVNALKSILCANISRNLQFKKYFFATLCGIVTSASIGIAMAMSGFGPWALVAQQMTNCIVDTLILAIVTKYKLSLKLSVKKIRELFDYGWKIFVASIISTIYDEVNPLIIGVKYTGADLSYYSKGRNFPHLINTTLGDTFSAVLFPAVSKVQDDKLTMLRWLRRFMSLSSFIIFPAMIGFLAVADNFVYVVLTEKWMGAVPYIRIFCLVYMLNIVQKGNLEVIRASGRSDLILIMEIIKKSLYLIVIVIFLIFTNTPEMLAAACFINTVIATIINTYPNRKIVGYSYRNQITDLLTNFITAVIMGIVVLLVGMIEINAFVLLLLQIATGGIVYIILNLLIKNPNLKYYWVTAINLIKKVKKDVR